MKKSIYCLKLNEQQIKELISDIFAEIGCEAAGEEYDISYNIQFDYGKNSKLCAKCFTVINKSSDVCNQLIEDYIAVDDFLHEYMRLNSSFLYFNIDCDMLQTYIIRSISRWKINGEPSKKQKYIIARFYGTLNEDFRCLVYMSDIECADEYFYKIDRLTAFGQSFNNLKFYRYDL